MEKESWMEEHELCCWPEKFKDKDFVLVLLVADNYPPVIWLVAPKSMENVSHESHFLCFCTVIVELYLISKILPKSFLLRLNWVNTSREKHMNTFNPESDWTLLAYGNQRFLSFPLIHDVKFQVIRHQIKDAISWRTMFSID